MGKYTRIRGKFTWALQSILITEVLKVWYYCFGNVLSPRWNSLRASYLKFAQSDIPMPRDILGPFPTNIHAPPRFVVIGGRAAIGWDDETQALEIG
jgi:hypothetical protein